MFTITLKFLQAVQLNNTTQWLHTNYDLYQQERKRFTKIMKELLDYGKTLNSERNDLEIKNCIFRFNRDLRYGPNKNPYKDHFGCEFAAYKRRSGRPCFYFELRPGASFVGVGTWRPDQNLEAKMRKHAILHFDQWIKIQSSKEFHNYFGEMRKPDPNNPDYPLQEYKSLYGLKKAFPDEESALKQLTPERQYLRKSKISYEKKRAYLSTLPKASQKYYEQLAFQKDRLWQTEIPNDLLTQDILIDQLKQTLKLAMPIILFLQEGCA